MSSEVSVNIIADEAGQVDPQDWVDQSTPESSLPQQVTSGSAEKTEALAGPVYPALPYMKQLDGLRAFALFGFLFAHWFPFHIISKCIPFYDGGVTIFFVMSVFLITSILLKSRRKIDSGFATRLTMGKHFYARRALRLFPVLYVTLLIAFALGVPTMAEQLPWNALYLNNIYCFLNDQMGVASHLWTLSVEEQFYILWALVILVFSRRAVWALLIVLIILAPTTRVVLFNMGKSTFHILPMACFDALSMGAMLSLISDRSWAFPRLRRLIPKTALCIGLPMYALMIAARSHGPLLGISPSIAWPLQAFFGALFFVWVVDSASRGFSGPMKRILEFPVATYLGRISYGIYVLHGFAPLFIRIALPPLGMDELLPYTHWFSVKFLATVALASLSWFLLEKPFLKLKKYFA